MKPIYFLSFLSIFLLAPASANADSFVRVKCDDQDVGAEVYLNGKFVGNCPVDAPAPAGIVELRARKIVDDDYEQLFEKHLSMVEGVPQKVELIMSAPQLTAEAKHRKEVAEASAQMRAAEAGDIEAMQKMAEYLDAGVGVEKDPSKAKIWRGKAEVATAQEQLRAANAGNINAMENIAVRYDTGRGVNKDTAQAQAWRAKAEATKREKIARIETARREERERDKQRRLDAVAPFKDVRNFYGTITTGKDEYGREVGGGERISDITISPLGFSVSASVGLTELPNNLQARAWIRNEASLHPSTWGKPGSMIARAALQQKTRSATDEHPLLVVAAK